MKTILYMAISANGYIARADDSTPWSVEEWERFRTAVARAGTLIVGRRTFDIMSSDGEFANSLGNPDIVVMTHRRLPDDTTAHAAGTFDEAIAYLTGRGHAEALIAGGSEINARVLHQLHEVHLDVEPFIFGSGKPLFAPLDSSLNLELLSCERYGTDGVHLHYRVVRSV